MLFLCLHMKKLMIFGLLPLLAEAQVNDKEISVNVKGMWYFGIELGTNSIPSFTKNEKKHSVEGGLTAEYYFAKQWSAQARIKYFETGVSFRNDESYGIFEGSVVSVPLDVKWEFPIHKNFRGNLKLGAAYNYETQNDYNFPSEMKTDYSRSFFSMNSGLGLSYFLSSRMAVYMDLESFRLGGYKGTGSLYLGDNYYTDNNHINLGVKYNFK